MDYFLSKAHIDMLKILVNIWALIVSTVTIATIFVFISQGGYTHPILLFVCIFAAISCTNVYRFHKIIHANNQICLRQLKVWVLTFVRGIFVSCLYLSLYVKNTFGSILFSFTYLASLFCCYYLKKGINSQ